MSGTILGSEDKIMNKNRINMSAYSLSLARNYARTMRRMGKCPPNSTYLLRQI